MGHSALPEPRAAGHAGEPALSGCTGPSAARLAGPTQIPCLVTTLGPDRTFPVQVVENLLR